ncbi:hypothetical protein ACROYT_G015292 [Oculina patagonica]
MHVKMRGNIATSVDQRNILLVQEESESGKLPGATAGGQGVAQDVQLSHAYQSCGKREVQQLAIFLAEQNEHKAHLKQQRLSKAKPKKSTKEATIQCDRQATADSKHTSEVAVQTDFPVYLMEDLREQVRQP